MIYYTKNINFLKIKKKNKKKIIRGKWYVINKKVSRRITARYHRLNDWVMDPKGYFLINLDRENNLIRVGYCVFEKLNNHWVTVN